MYHFFFITFSFFGYIAGEVAKPKGCEAQEHFFFRVFLTERQSRWIVCYRLEVPKNTILDVDFYRRKKKKNVHQSIRIYIAFIMSAILLWTFMQELYLMVVGVKVAAKRWGTGIMSWF